MPMLHIPLAPVQATRVRPTFAGNIRLRRLCLELDFTLFHPSSRKLEERPSALQSQCVNVTFLQYAPMFRRTEISMRLENWGEITLTYSVKPA